MPGRTTINALRVKHGDELVELGRHAFSCGDRATWTACVDELERRGGKAARLAAVKLRPLARADAPPESSTARGPFPRQIAQWESFCDSSVEPERFRLVRGARRSIWLSSYTFASNDLTDLLIEKAREIREVRVIVGNRFSTHHKHKAAVERLERAGVMFITPRATHSKLLIVDDRYTMNGSANAHGVHRDFCIVHDDPDIANAAKRYLAALENGR